MNARKRLLNLLHSHVLQRRKNLLERTRMNEGEQTEEILDALSVIQLEELKYQER